MEKTTGISVATEIDVKKIISAFYYDFPRDFDYEGESHEGWEFVFVEKGKVRVRADDSTYVLRSGEMVCHKPFEFHSIKPYHCMASVIIFCFSCEGFKMKYFNNKILSVGQRQKHYLNDIAEVSKSVFSPKAPLDIVKDGTMDKKSNVQKADVQFLKNTIELLILSLMESESTERSKRVESYAHSRMRRSLTENIKKYLEDNMARTIKLDEVCEKFSYSLSSIKRIFKKETGYGIIEYLNNMRIERAKELLLQGEMTVEQIGEAVGFMSPYYFSKAFKEKTGLSPTKYRKEKSA